MIMDLPYEIRMYVVVQMPYPDVLRFCATSTEAKKVCNDDYFWKWKITHDFPKKPAEGHEGKWNELYKKYWNEAQEKLVECAKQGHLKCVESLLQLGIDPNFQTKYRLAALGTALILASWKGHADVVRVLLDHDANPNIQDIGETQLLWWLL